MKGHSQFNENWVQDKIAENPGLLGLGELIFKDKERIQPRAGRLDLLFQDPDDSRRYEVEIQLGKTDESHIIRTIEYWDIERKRYPQYDHVAVIVAEDITSRFLNVISLFNGTIPLIAIQMNALKIENNVALLATTVLDQVELGFDDEDEDIRTIVDRTYWEGKVNTNSLRVVDDVFEVLHALDSELELKYNKYYIGLSKNNHPCNFVIFKPKVKATAIEVKMKQSEELETKIEESDLELIDYRAKHRRYRIRITPGSVEANSELLAKILADSRAQSG